MKQNESFSNSSCTEQIQLPERELSAFIAAVSELFGAEEATASAGLARRITVDGLLASLHTPRLADCHDRSLGSVGNSAKRCFLWSNLARHIEKWYGGIADTFVQLF